MGRARQPGARLSTGGRQGEAAPRSALVLFQSPVNPKAACSGGQVCPNPAIGLRPRSLPGRRSSRPASQQKQQQLGLSIPCALAWARTARGTCGMTPSRRDRDLSQGRWPLLARLVRAHHRAKGCPQPAEPAPEEHHLRCCGSFPASSHTACPPAPLPPRLSAAKPPAPARNQSLCSAAHAGMLCPPRLGVRRSTHVAAWLRWVEWAPTRLATAGGAARRTHSAQGTGHLLPAAASGRGSWKMAAQDPSREYLPGSVD